MKQTGRIQDLVWLLQMCGHYTSYSSRVFLEEDFKLCYAGLEVMKFQGAPTFLERIQKELVTARILCGCKSARVLPKDWAEKFIRAIFVAFDRHIWVYYDMWNDTPLCYKMAVQRILQKL